MLRILSKRCLAQTRDKLFPILQFPKPFSTKETDTHEVGGYAKAFEKFENIKDQNENEPPQNFASLLRNSRLIDLGDPENKIVTGKIFHIVEDDLYIDFGWKFHCVCTRPKKNAESYVRGSKVRLMIKQLELSSKFLGYEKDLTLLEADCLLLGLVQERTQNTKTQ
ncbi:unnamed protein product [Phyllotreta striolata]|uniref:Mitochondrial ribosomal protein S28 n=1 Tax=Phyllotreta striolata TaxID=444603 RepID=A0A9N9TVZ4_PHYSR|nr:unnamed protein product [Phyllotreta striolata]